MKLPKVYLNSDLISDPTKVKNFKEEEMEALGKIGELKDRSKIEIYTSGKTKREIEKHQNLNKKGYFKFVYSLISKIPEENIIKTVPATFDSIVFDEATFDGAVEKEDSLFASLKQIFDEDDAEHIFQAEKNNLDYFLTLDKKTILNKIKQNKNKFEKIHLKLRIVSPSQLIKELEPLLNIKIKFIMSTQREK